MSCESQQWSSPAEIMKRRKLKKKSKSITGENTVNNSQSTVQIVNKGVKRSNPFSRVVTSNKRTNIINPVEDSFLNTSLVSVNPDRQDDEIVSKTSQQELFSSLDTLDAVAQEETNKTPVTSRNISMLQSKGRQLQDRLVFYNDTPEKSKDSITEANSAAFIPDSKVTEDKWLDVLPIDWSIKGKLRVSSEQPLSWCVQMKSTDEASGVHNFVGSNDQWSTENSEASFHRCCLYWQHPSLPWTKLFPRILSENKISKVNVLGNNEEVKKVLYNDWSDSFTSAFHQLRSNISPYFYLCSHQFTVLFRGVGVAGNKSISALLTPTTRGLREALKIEGIDFKMPLLEKKKTVEEEKENEDVGNQVDNTAGADKTGEEEDCLDTDEGASVWLESLGLDKKQFPSLDPHKVKIQKEGYRRVDNRPESMIYVEGGEVQALFNFLLNCRSCIANSGEQAGIPPTILSPSPFRGATLKSNKVKYSHAKQTDSQGNSFKSHILEINGPVLPHNILNMTALLKQRLEGKFSFTCNNHEPTAPFNVCLNTTSDSTDKQKPVIRNVNLHPDCTESLFSGDKLEKDVCAMKTITASKLGYSVIV